MRCATPGYAMRLGGDDLGFRVSGVRQTLQPPWVAGFFRSSVLIGCPDESMLGKASGCKSVWGHKRVGLGRAYGYARGFRVLGLV